jgi:hypothetical protein
MALHLYRRHRRECLAGHAEDSRSGEFDERRKGWKRCECLIYVSGTLAGKFSRRPTQKTTWDDAHGCVRLLEAARSWDGLHQAKVAARQTPDTPPPAHNSAVAITPAYTPAPVTIEGITIANVVDAFLGTKQAAVAYSTFRKHRTFTKQLRAFAEGRGYVMLDQFRPLDIDVLYAGSSLGPRSKAKWLEWLRSFFQYAVNRDWLPKSPVRGFQ